MITFIFSVMSMIVIALAGAADLAMALHAPILGALLIIASSALALLMAWMMYDLTRPASSR